MLSDKHKLLLQALQNSSALNEDQIGKWKLLLVADSVNEQEAVELPEKLDFIILLESDKLSQSDILKLKQSISTDILDPLAEKHYYTFAVHTRTSFRKTFFEDYNLTDKVINAKLDKAAQLSAFCQLLPAESDDKKKIDYKNFLVSSPKTIQQSTNDQNTNTIQAALVGLCTNPGNSQQLHQLKESLKSAFNHAGVPITNESQLLLAISTCAQQFAQDMQAEISSSMQRKPTYT